MKGLITSEAFVAFSQCPRKAFFVFRGEPKGRQHELEQVISERAVPAGQPISRHLLKTNWPLAETE